MAYQANDLLVVESFQSIRKKDCLIEILVQWKGFDKNESNWVSITSLAEDVPDLLKEYINDLKSHGTQKERSMAKTVQFNNA